MRHSFKEWFAATRYWSFPVSTMPVVATFAYLCSRHLVPSGSHPVICFLLALLGVVLLHSAGNLLSDWFDYRKGVDNENAFAVPNLVFHKFEPKEYLVFSIILFALGCAVGLALVLMCGSGLLIIGGVGVVLTVLYSFLKFRALGDLDIFLIFGLLIVIGTSYVVTGSVCWDAFVISLPLGIITVSVLHANNTLDIDSDSAAGIRTFAMTIGGKASSILYRVYMVLPFISVIVSVVLGLLNPLSLLCLLSAVPACKNFKAASRYDELGTVSMSGLDKGSAGLQLVFSLLLSVGLFLSALLQ